jgi:hypothetical protein
MNTPRSGKALLLSCDTLAVRPAGGTARTIFGKNADRPTDEPQPSSSSPLPPIRSGRRCAVST